MKLIRAEYVHVGMFDYVTGDYMGQVKRPVKTLKYQEIANVYTVETYKNPHDDETFDIPDFTGVYATLELAESVYFELP